jgi:restriction endonuclease S subunit
MWVKYFASHYPEKPVDWKVQQKEVYGYDIDAKVAGIAALNMFMESGGHRFENILKRDSLYDDIPISGVDVILANMPFGVKGLTHAECCSRVKALKLNGTKSEPLFLQLMMASLNPGGRCAVVVPDGMLTNISKCHDGTRKYLLDHFELRRVIKMKGKFFMNTGIQPSILFFEQTGKPTAAVEFWDVTANVDGSITETLAVTVPRAKMDASCSFDMRRYLEGDKPVANPTGFPMVKLSEACEVSKGKRCLVSVESGGYPYQDVAHISRMVEKYILDTPAVLTPRAMSIGRFVYTDEKCHPSDDMFILKPKDNLSAKYLYYYCLLNLSTKFKESLHGVKPTIDYSVFDYTHIVIPPLPIQEEIVTTLDRIYNPGTTELADTIKMTDRAMDLVLASPGGATLEPIVEAQRLIRKSAQMVADVKAQMAAIVKASMTGLENKKYILSDLANDNPESLTKADKFDTINYVDLGSVKEGVISSVQLIAFAEKPSRAQRKIKDGDIIWGGVRPLSRSYAYLEKAVENMIGSSGFIVVRNKDTTKVLSKYLYYAITTDKCVGYLNSHSTGTSYPAFNSATIMAYEVNIPPITVQTRTLERLTALESQLTALESLQKQTEDNARFILDSYLGTHVDSCVESGSVVDSIEHVDE